MSRTNIYEEELTNDVEVVSTTTDEGKTFYGVRFFLKSHPDLHHTETDDDRSAVTFWMGTRQRAEIFRDHIRRDFHWVEEKTDASVIGRHP